ncbi:hypothetical protein MYX84_13750 [Acidobacteria bacterium AH-259-O06]|nr:hypothetical protein [Acidobacteria bacterium AH-259-O06]
MATNVSPPVEEEQTKVTKTETSGPKAESPIPTVSKRLVSLDTFRGFTMFWIVGGGSLMVGFEALGYNPVIDFIIYHLNHTPWQGLRYYDLIWPSFMLMVGMSLRFRMQNARSPNPSGR